MDSNGKPFNGYDSGADAWSDNAMNYGIDEAVGICGRYLEMQLKYEQPESEKQHCRELFSAMYEATAGTAVLSKIVYPYDFKTANNRMETSYYHKNRAMNEDCTRAIDDAISASCYKTNYYNLELAAMSVIGGHGFQRVNAVLAHQIQKHSSDGRYSYQSKYWAHDYIFHENTHTFLRSHATLIEDFTTYVRKLHENLGAERFALLGNEENGDDINGYRVIRSIMVNANEGYVIAHNPDACDPYVCWKLSISDDGERRYDWGLYGEFQDAVNGYNARLFVAFN